MYIEASFSGSKYIFVTIVVIYYFSQFVPDGDDQSLRELQNLANGGSQKPICHFCFTFFLLAKSEFRVEFFQIEKICPPPPNV